MSTRSVSLGSALAAFFSLSAIAGITVLILLASGVSAGADDHTVETEAEGVKEIRQIESLKGGQGLDLKPIGRLPDEIKRTTTDGTGRT